jgi:hypothetical protein
MEYEQLPAKKKQKYAYMLRLITNGGFVENEENTKLLQKGIKKYDIEYLVINKSDDYSMIIENVGGKLVGETQVYMIYRFEKE